MDKDTIQQYYNRIKEEIQATYIKALQIGDYMRNGFGKGNIRKIKRLEKSYNEILKALYALKENLNKELECKNNL